MNKDTYEKIQTIVEKEEFLKRYVLQEVLNLIFWHDYNGNYITPGEKQEILNIMDSGCYVCETAPYIKWERDKGVELANKIRKKINLPLLKYENDILIEETNKSNDIPLEISEEIIEDTLVGALDSDYGGSNYWVEEYDYKNKKPSTSHDNRYLPTYITTPLSKDGILILKDRESNEKWELTREKVLKGIKIMSQKYKKHFSDMITENGDCDTADVMLQCALFGEIRYG